MDFQDMDKSRKIEETRKKLEEKLERLTNFQRATVNRIHEIFKVQNQALVADEVGLGKTLVATGVVARALLDVLEQIENKGSKTCLKVVYICSNQSIAGQNLKKLNIIESKDTGEQVSIAQNRLSMQHLNVTIQEHQDEENHRLLRLIPLTPATSFTSKAGKGLKQERALIFIIPRESGLFEDIPTLSEYLSYDVGNWGGVIKELEHRIEVAQKYTEGKYLKNIYESVLDFVGGDKSNALCGADVLDNLVKDIADTSKSWKARTKILGQLRSIFSYISTGMLEPDLVIMDEFQRYKDLVTLPTEEGQYSDMVYLARKFLEHPVTHTLLLSATPFKMYATTEEIITDKENNSYTDFLNLLRFLFYRNDDNTRHKDFCEVWEQYAQMLYASQGISEALIEQKMQAEDYLYEAMTRTERNIVGNDTVSTDKTPEPLKVDDLKSYLVMSDMYKNMYAQKPGGIKTRSFYIEYAKSCPYLMSFMKYYVVKKYLVDFYKAQQNKELAQKAPAWLDWKEIDQYRKIDFCNPKLRALVKASLGDKKGEFLLWVPPALPYYELQGVFKENQDFTKTIVFSSWEMVPRMVSILLSYEAERRTMEGLFERQGEYLKNTKQNEIHFFRRSKTEKRYPAARLKFTPKSDTFTSWLYPSLSLCNAYNPEKEFLAGRTLKGQVKGKYYKPGIEDVVLEVLLKLVEKLPKKWEKQKKIILQQTMGRLQNTAGWHYDHWKKWKNYLGTAKTNKSNTGALWYYLLPMLLDNSIKPFKSEEEGKKGIVLEWLESYGYRDNNNLSRVKEKFIQAVTSRDLENLEFRLDNPPEDLLFVLRDMAIASPAICCLRAMVKTTKPAETMDMAEYMALASRKAELFANYFNRTENTAAIMNLFQDKSVEEDDEANQGTETLDNVGTNVGWKNTITYCKYGCFQAMLEEYRHMLKGELTEDSEQNLYETMKESLKVHGARYDVDFVDCLKQEEDYDEAKAIKEGLPRATAAMRTHYAISFSKGKGNEDKSENRRESVRSSFNSPLRPFVLTSTSVGQEGLDFHNYCMQIMHWNLPTNPIDMEQREGRINRYKCLAIRKSLAKIFKARRNKGQSVSHLLDNIEGKDLWERLFTWAKKEAQAKAKHSGKKYCDLIPYWSLGDLDPANTVAIKRLVPLFEFSEDEKAYEQLVEAMTTYRLTIGQARQEELLEHFNKQNISPQEKEKLFINLCPFMKEEEKKD